MAASETGLMVRHALEGQHVDHVNRLIASLAFVQSSCKRHSRFSQKLKVSKSFLNHLDWGCLISISPPIGNPEKTRLNKEYDFCDQSSFISLPNKWILASHFLLRGCKNGWRSQYYELKMDLRLKWRKRRMMCDVSKRIFGVQLKCYRSFVC